MQIINAGIREAKINLSKLLKHVKNGNEVILTDRGRPIGKIVPIGGEELSLEERFLKLEDQGIIESLPKDRRVKTPQPIPITDNLAQKFLREDRDAGR